MKAVLDPNVIIAALVSTGTTAAVLDAWLDNHSYDIVVCPHLLAELREVLRRPKFAKVEREAVTALLARLETEGEAVEDPDVQLGATPDPDDDYLVALARAARAECIVSGDTDLHAASLEIESPHARRVLALLNA